MLKPMLASLEEAPLADPQLVYEPKYDGIRVIAEVQPARGGPTVRLWSRLGNEKTAQFPEVAAALASWGKRLPDPVVLDGEVVALDSQGQPTGFQRLQGRIHVAESGDSPAAGAVAFVIFDLLRAAGHDLREHPLHQRRAALERLLASAARQKRRILRISEQVRGDGRALYARALEDGWEGLIAKHAESRYRSGKRSPDWRKLKIVREQEFVVGGWTEPRHARSYFGALLLGVYDGDQLVYVGHTGTGFDQRELARVMALLRPREVATAPFRERPRTNERPHWVTPDLVAQIKFTEWTTDGKLRHPVYIGLRDDKAAREVRREGARRLHASTRARLGEADGPESGGPVAPRARSTRRSHRTQRTVETPGSSALEVEALLRTLQDMEDARRDGTLDLGGGRSLAVTNLHKPFWPRLNLTKGDLFRYYVRIAPVLLPAIADRPLVMKRYPNGIGGKPFYQHRATDVPAGVRVQPVPGTGDGPGDQSARRPHLIGGDLLTLLYTTQLAAISQDPWFSRIQTPRVADHVALDLDPSDGVSFGQVLDVARAIRDALGTVDAFGAPKTSGASGLHVYIPMPPGTPYDAGLLFCQIVATVVARRHPRIATIERRVGARGRRVYVDYLQNIMGKTLATAYSARASDYAGVSTPLTWQEVDDRVDREAFTVTTVPDRVARVGDLWSALRAAPGVDLSKAARFGL